MTPFGNMYISLLMKQGGDRERVRACERQTPLGSHTFSSPALCLSQILTFTRARGL